MQSEGNIRPEDSLFPEAPSGLDVAAVLDVIARVSAAQRLTYDELHKLLYYAQGISLAVHGRPLFRGSFKAATHGPVLDDLASLVRVRPNDWWVALREHRIEVPNKVVDFLRDVHSVFGPMGALGLSRATQSERPWQRAREGLAWDNTGTPSIPDAFIRDFFGEMIEFGEDVMSDLDIRSAPGTPAWLLPLRLATNVKFLATHPLFEEKEARQLRVDLGFGATPDDWTGIDYSPLSPEPEEHAARRHG